MSSGVDSACSHRRGVESDTRRLQGRSIASGLRPPAPVRLCWSWSIDTMLYAALTPLLPHFQRAYDLSKGGVGALAAAFAIGVLVAAVPGGARRGAAGRPHGRRRRARARHGRRASASRSPTASPCSSPRGSSRASAPRSPGPARSPGSRSRPHASGAGGRSARRWGRPCSVRCSDRRSAPGRARSACGRRSRPSPECAPCSP